MKTPIERTEPCPTITPSTTSERAPMKQSSSMIVGLAWSGSRTPADADAAREMNVLADLRAGSDRDPGVHHGATIHVGAEVDEGGHEDGARRHISRSPHDAVRHGTEACGGPLVLAPALELRRDLIVPGRAARAARNHGHVVQSKRQQDGLLEPLVHGPTLASRGARYLGRRRGACRNREGPRAWSTASRTAPVVPGPIEARSSKACSIVA